MKARDKFKEGDRVEFSADGRRFLGPDNHTGTVVGFSPDDHLVRVLCDGRKFPSSFHEMFWKPAKRKKAAERISR